MRVSGATLLVGALVLGTAVPGAANDDGDPWADDDGFGVEESVVDILLNVGRSANDLWFRPGWGEDAEGEPCYLIEVDQDATDSAQADDADLGDNSSWIDSDQFIDGMTESGLAGSINNLLARIGLGQVQLPEQRCPGSDPEDMLQVVWLSEVCPPPPPTPIHMAPENSALTGMPGYLEIGGDNPAIVTCLGEEITATARYVIRWGDGTTTETTSQGGAYPDGDVRHTYADTGERVIVVEAYWRGEWNGIDLGEVTNPTTDTLPVAVTQMQAVRTTPNR